MCIASPAVRTRGRSGSGVRASGGICYISRVRMCAVHAKGTLYGRTSFQNLTVGCAPLACESTHYSFHRIQSQVTQPSTYTHNPRSASTRHSARRPARDAMLHRTPTHRNPPPKTTTSRSARQVPAPGSDTAPTPLHHTDGTPAAHRSICPLISAPGREAPRTRRVVTRRYSAAATAGAATTAASPVALPSGLPSLRGRSASAAASASALAPGLPSALGSQV